MLDKFLFIDNPTITWFLLAQRAQRCVSALGLRETVSIPFVVGILIEN